MSAAADSTRRLLPPQAPPTAGEQHAFGLQLVGARRREPVVLRAAALPEERRRGVR